MSRLLTIRHHAPVQRLKICATEATVVTTSDATEIFARVAPIASGTSRNQCPRQTQVIYDSLSELLSDHHDGLGDVVMERVFLRDVQRDWGDFQQVRSECYRRRGVAGRFLPAITCLGQPPCRPGQDVELLVYAVAPTAGSDARVESLATTGPHTAAKLVEIGRSRHLYLSTLVGRGPNGQPWGTFRQQSELMWSNLLETLDTRGVSPANVLRASVYLGDIARDYGDFRAAHDQFLNQHNLDDWPVLAVHGGHLHPHEALCGMDLHALVNPEAAQIHWLPSKTPGDAARFVRGVKVVLREHTYLFVSATAAAVDKDMSSAEALALSVQRTVAELRELFRGHGADFGDLAQVVTRLKSTSLVEPYESLCAGLDWTHVPHTIVRADLCRPELLAQIELTAIIPTP